VAVSQDILQSVALLWVSHVYAQFFFV